MSPEERQKIINNNRALRDIKNNLELLLENGVLTDDAFEDISQALPAETSLRAGNSRVASPVINTPAIPEARTPVLAPPVEALASLTVTPHQDPAPAYTSLSSPNLPPRGPPPPKAEIARARAFYRYAEPNDCSFEAGDDIAVLEYMNNEWWLGRNLRTGKEGVFPVNYVTVVNPTMSHAGVNDNSYPNEKQGYGNGYAAPHQQPYQQPYQGAYTAPYQQSQTPNPYNSGVPPMAIAEGSSQQQDKPVGGKAGEMGKKFGRKMGNATIFGAGATIGSNLVNSIF